MAGGLRVRSDVERKRLAGLAAVAAGMLSLALVRPPDVLVSGDGKLLY